MILQATRYGKKKIKTNLILYKFMGIAVSFTQGILYECRVTYNFPHFHSNTLTHRKCIIANTT